ncbi:putative Nudix hydrolase ymfB [Actinobacillus equuli]|nr:putative Nudix hydrolase ymfB [Actinobacillus equuli]
MHKPNITLACVVHCKGKFLFVEEIEYGKRTLNQPAGHLEANETLLEGASRELFEETGIRAQMQHLIKFINGMRLVRKLIIYVLYLQSN